jgi:hypothetical protein
VTRTISAILLSYKFTEKILEDMEDEDGIEWLEMLTLPNIGLQLTLLVMVMAAYVSWTEEVSGEDGLELSDDESSEGINQNMDGTFALETSIDDGEGSKPKYHLFVVWKWFTLLYQVAFVVELIVIILWKLGGIVP